MRATDRHTEEEVLEVGNQQEELQKQAQMSTHKNQRCVALGAAACVRLTAILRRRSLRWVTSRRSCGMKITREKSRTKTLRNYQNTG
jgi:hypothetical protein